MIDDWLSLWDEVVILASGVEALRLYGGKVCVRIVFESASYAY